MREQKVYTYKFGSQPVQETIDMMIYHINLERSNDKTNILIKNFTDYTISKCKSHDIDCEINCIFKVVQNGIRYKFDPLDQETIVLPSEMIRRIVYDRKLAQGDCDDHSMLLATMLVTAGHGARFKVISENKNEPYHHIYVEAFNRNRNKWIPLDAIHKDFRVGQEVPHEKSKTFDLGIIEAFD